MIDRLGDEFHTKSELKNIRKEVRSIRWYNERLQPEPKQIAVLELHSTKGDTGKCLLVLTADWQETIEEVNADWHMIGVHAVLGEISDPIVIADELYVSLLLVLDTMQLRYTPKQQLVLAEVMYKNAKLVNGLISKMIISS